MMRFLLLSFFSVSFLQGQNTPAEALAKASRAGDVKTVETLISAGVDCNSFDRYGKTPLYYAASFNRNDVVALLLEHKADPNLGSSRPRRVGEFPQTPLQVAASMGNLRMASMLIAAGAHVNLEQKAERSALQFAVDGNHLDVIRFLIEKGADVDARDAEGVSPLDEAVWRGDLDATAILLAHGSRLNEAEPQSGATPINEAVFRGQSQLVRYLLQFHPDLRAADKRGYTPLENAIRMKNTDAALLLLDTAPKEQKTPEFLNKMVGFAVIKDQSRLVDALLQQGGVANGRLPSGDTLLDAAVSADAGKSVEVLLKHGADPNKGSQNGTSPLENAALRGFASVIETLVDHGALVNQIDRGSGTTALYAAASFGRREAVDVLLRHGSDPRLCGKGGHGPYAAAMANGYSEIASEIEHHGGRRCRINADPTR